MLSAAQRIHKQPPPDNCTNARFPVALLFVRGDRGGDGAKLAEQAVASFEYWDKDSDDSMDIVMSGWSRSGDEFIKFRKLIENNSTWKYSGETDILLLNFEFTFSTSEVYGCFNYDEVIVLPVEAMLRDKQIGSIDGFVAELIAASCHVSQSARYSGESPIWELSDHAGMLKTKKATWGAIKKLILKDYAEKFSAVEHFAVRDLQRDGSPFLNLPIGKSREILDILITR